MRNASSRDCPSPSIAVTRAAETLRTLEPSIVASRRLDIDAYFLLVEGEYWPQGQRVTLDTLTSLGFRVNPARKLVSSVEEMVAFIDQVGGRARDPRL